MNRRKNALDFAQTRPYIGYLYHGYADEKDADEYLAFSELLDRQYVGMDQSAEYVTYAKKRLERAVETASKGVNGAATETFALNRASRVNTQTDAFGRPRVARRQRAAKSA